MIELKGGIAGSIIVQSYANVVVVEILILSVAVVEFGTHTPRYWSETYHGVSMDC